MKKIAYLILLCSTSGWAQSNNTLFNKYNKTIRSQQLFTENKGQIVDMNGKPNADILYETRGNYNMYFRKQGITYMLYENEFYPDSTVTGKKLARISSQRIDVNFVGSNKNIKIKAEQPSSYISNYYRSYCPDGITGVKSYKQIYYEGVYANIDLVFHNNNDSVGIEYDFIVKPNGNPQEIKLKYSGNNGLQLLNNKLIIKSMLRKNIEECIPKAYQLNENGSPVEISCRYKLNEDNNEISFAVGKYNTSKPLIIDPWVTYFGGNDGDAGKGIALNSNGDVFIAGVTYSGNLPLTSLGYQSAFGGGFSAADIFVAKFDNEGGGVWATYYGGSDQEDTPSISRDTHGNIIVCGNTYSGNFPTPPVGAFQSTNPAGASAFLVKFDNNGTRLWATYYNNSSSSNCFALAMGPTDDIYMVGTVNASGLPVTSASFQSVYRGAGDGFVTKFSSGGTHLWSTYVGGTLRDDPTDITVDGVEDLIIAGTTTSPNFPIPPGGYTFQPSRRGLYDVFLLKLDKNGQTGKFATYYGGTTSPGIPISNGAIVTTDIYNNIYLGGVTTTLDFPVTTGAYQSVINGASDAFVAKFDPTGHVQWSTIYGSGSNAESVMDIKAGMTGNLYISGRTNSSDFIVTTDAYQTSFGGGSADAYFAKLNAANGYPLCSSYIGASGIFEDINGIFIKDSYIYMTGQVEVIGGGGIHTTPGVFQPAYGGGWGDAFVTKFCTSDCGATLSEINLSVSQNVGICPGGSAQLTVGGSSNYVWYTTTGLVSQSGATITVNPTVTTTYYVYGSCANTNSVTVTLYTLPTYQKEPGAQVLCDNGTVSTIGISGNSDPGSTYQWTPATYLNNTTGALVNAQPTLLGIPNNYTLTITDSHGCIQQETYTTTLYPLPTLTTTSSATTCSGISTQLTATGNSTLAGSSASISWDPPQWLNTTNTGTVTATPMIAGTTHYTVTIQDDNSSCQEYAYTTLVAIPSPTITTSPDITTCGSGITATLSASSSQNNYNWSPVTGLDNPTNQITILTPPGTGNYTYTVTSTDPINNCSSQSTINIEVVAYIQVDPGNNSSICFGETITLTASGANSTRWLPSTTPSSTLTITPNSTSTYTVEGTTGTCIDSTNITIYVNPLPVITITASDAEICTGETITLTASGGHTYTWNNGQTTNLLTITSVVNSGSTESYMVIGADTNNCTNTSDAISITVNPLPVITASDNQTIVINQSVQLTVEGANSYAWEPSFGLSCTDCSTPLANPTVTTTYTIIGTNNEGCMDTTELTITVEIICTAPYVPNAFSPNGDGQNDELQVKDENCNYPGYQLDIYDRWGNEIFHSEDIKQAWKGTNSHNKEMHTGVYVYRLLYAPIQGKEIQTDIGNVSLIR